MGFADLGTSSGGFSNTSSDLDTAAGLREFAESNGIDLADTSGPSLGRRMFEGVTNILLAGEKLSASVMQLGRGIEPEDIDPTLSPSDILFGKAPESKSIGEGLKRAFTTPEGLKRLAADILFDPLTYLTLGTGAAMKVAVSKGGAKIALNKGGRELVSDLAQEIALKGMTQKAAKAEAKQQVARLATGAGTIEQAGGLGIIGKALGKTGEDVTAASVKQFLEEGGKGLVKESAVRFGGKELTKLPKFSKIYDDLLEATAKVPGVGPLSRGLNEVGQAFGKLFKRDFGLPEEFIPFKQRLIDSFDASASRTKKELRLVFTGTTKEQRIAITHAIEAGAIDTLPTHLRQLAKRVKQIEAGIAREEAKRGLLDSTMKDYVPHIYKNKAKAKTIVKAVKQGQPSALLKFNNARVIQDTATARALGLDPIEDIAELLHIRILASERAKLTQDFMSEVSQAFGIRSKIPTGKLKTIIKQETRFAKGGKLVTTESKAVVAAMKRNPELKDAIIASGDEYVNFSSVAKGVPKQFQDIALPRHIAEDIDKMGKRFFDNEEAMLLLRGYDKVNNYWKGSVTVLFPAFHSRNAISNVANVFLDVGVKAFSPKFHKMAVDIVRGADGKLVNEFGETMTFKEIRQQMKAHQVFQDRLAITDVGRITPQNVLKKMSPVEYGRKVGRAIENEARVMEFVANLHRGLDFDDAAFQVKRFLFDYDNLSIFEKDFLRRAIPFYTWTRKNVALQLRALATTPGRVASQVKLFETANDLMSFKLTPEQEELLPDWIAAGFKLTVAKKDDDRSFLTGFDLPIESFLKLAGDGLDNPFKAVMNQISPFLKIPVEIAFGKKLFKDVEIGDDDSGNFAENLPEPIKEWLDFSQDSFDTDEGKTVDIFKVDPQRKWIYENVTSMLGVGRLSSASVVNGMTALHKAVFSDEVITVQDKADIVRLFTGVTQRDFNLESLRRSAEKRAAEEAAAELERKGEIATFEKRFAPKD